MEYYIVNELAALVGKHFASSKSYYCSFCWLKTVKVQKASITGTSTLYNYQICPDIWTFIILLILCNYFCFRLHKYCPGFVLLAIITFAYTLKLLSIASMPIKAEVLGVSV